MLSDADDVAARLRAELPCALRDGQVVGYFQPEVELSTGRLMAAELLARWEHPDLGILQPALFIPLVQELGLMEELTGQMLRQALVQHRAWAAAGWTVPVSVNIGPGCVDDPDFPDTVARLLSEEQVPGRMLTLEVSEETGTTAASTACFTRLAAFGVRVSLDDFGTGFVSLESLGGWPIDELKLDHSIVRPVVSSATFRTIVGTTIDLAHQLGVRVVAEGIESEAIKSELGALGCDIGQGFFLGRPMAAAVFTEWIRDPARRVPHRAAALPASRPPGGQAGPWRRPGQAAGRAAGRAASAVRRTVRPVGGRALTVAVVLMAVYGSWQLFRWGGRPDQEAIGDSSFVPVVGAAAFMAWLASRRTDLGHNSCRAWRLLAIALALYLLGDLLQLAYEAGMHRAYPAWAYLAFYPVAFWGLLSFRDRHMSGPEWLRLLLEMGMEAIGAWMLIWFVALGPAVAAAHGHFGLFNLASYSYPVGDLLLLFGTLTVLVRGAPRSSVPALRIFAVSMVAYVAADVTYDHMMLHSHYVGGDRVDTLWILAQVLIFLAAACQLRATAAGVPEPPPRPAPARPSFLPYLALAGSYLLLAVIGTYSVRLGSLGGGLLASAIALTFLASARQYIAVHDYGGLAARYQQLASVDDITGLHNRRHFMEAAEAAVAHAGRLGQPLFALMLDVDNFKQINDTHGHTTGDKVLAEIAQACREEVRPDDIVGRYGGDEFALIIVGITSRRATQIAGQLARPAVRVPGRDGKPLSYTVSAGIAEYLPGYDLPTLLGHADMAMYEAKRAGGGSWRVYDSAMEASQAATTRATAPAQRTAGRRSTRTARGS